MYVICTLNDILLTVYTIEVYTYKTWVIMVPYKIKQKGYLLRSYLVDTRRMSLFTVEQLFLPVERLGDA